MIGLKQSPANGIEDGAVPFAASPNQGVVRGGWKGDRLAARAVLRAGREEGGRGTIEQARVTSGMTAEAAYRLFEAEPR